jgi:hypothetical protein
MTSRLLALLQARAGRHGLVLARGAQLEAQLRCSPDHLSRALDELVAARRVEILAPMPYLVLAFLPRPWSGIKTAPGHEPQQISSNARPSQEEVPVSSSSYAAAIQSREVGVAGEGEALLAEVLGALGPEADRDEFRTILARYSPSLVRRCLRRVMATKAIRVSRTALFRSLLIKLSH